MFKKNRQFFAIFVEISSSNLNKLCGNFSDYPANAANCQNYPPNAPNCQMKIAKISDYRGNFRFSLKFEIFAQNDQIFFRSRRAARPLPPPPRQRHRCRCGGCRRGGRAAAAAAAVAAAPEIRNLLYLKSTKNRYYEKLSKTSQIFWKNFPRTSRVRRS